MRALSLLLQRSLVLTGLFAVAIAGLMMSVGILVRFPLGGPSVIAFGKIFLYTTSVIVIVVAESLRKFGSATPSHRRLLGLAAVVFLSPVAAILLRNYSDLLLLPMLGLVLIYSLYGILPVLSKLHLGETILTICLGLIFGLVLFFNINSWGYATVFSPEQTLIGAQGLDTLFHASIANALANYSTVSTMLDGLPVTRYHFLSHLLLGGIGLWLRTTAIEAYYLGTQVALVPLLIFSLAASLINLWPQVSDRVPPVLCFIVPLVLLAASDLFGMTTYLVSESYLVGLILFLWTLPLLVEWIDGAHGALPGIDLALMAIIGVLAGVSKISVGFVLAVAVGGVCVWRAGITVRNCLLYGISIFTLYAGVSVLVRPSSNVFGNIFGPFDYIREYGWDAIGSMNLIPFLFYAAAVQIIRKDRKTKLVAMLFLFIGLVSVTPALLLNIPGGNGGYFSGIGNFAAILFLSGVIVLPRLAAIAAQRRVISSAIAVLFGLIAVNSEKRLSVPRTLDQFKEIQETVENETGQYVGSNKQYLALALSAFQPNNTNRKAIRELMPFVPGARIVRTLGNADLVGRKDVIVFVPPENKAYWMLYKSHRHCLAEPFVIPVMVGLPLIKGLSPDPVRCPLQPNWGYYVYGDDSRSEDLTDGALCERTRRLGFSEVAILSSPEAVRLLPCDRVVDLHTAATMTPTGDRSAPQW